LSETETFEIYFDDLSEDAKKRFLSFVRLKRPEDGNYGIFPLATFEVETEVLKENEQETKRAEREEAKKERKKPESVSFN
jgi:hypothetical protein